MKVCIVGTSWKLDTLKEAISVVPGPINDREVINRAVAGCDGVLTVLVPWGEISIQPEQLKRSSTSPA